MFCLFFLVSIIANALKDPSICVNCKFAIVDKSNPIQSKCSLFEKTKIDCFFLEQSILSNPLLDKMKEKYAEKMKKNNIGDFFITGILDKNKEYHDCITARKFETMCGAQEKYYVNASYTPYEGTLV
jgi:hypothetical protein